MSDPAGKAYTRFRDLWVHNDFAGIAAEYAPEGRFSGPGNPRLVGRKEIETSHAFLEKMTPLTYDQRLRLHSRIVANPS